MLEEKNANKEYYVIKLSLKMMKNHELSLKMMEKVSFTDILKPTKFITTRLTYKEY
jgi:hypothetical protein